MDGAIRKVLKISGQNLDFLVVVVPGHYPDFLYDLPRKIRPIWTGCEVPDSNHIRDVFIERT